MSLNIYQDNVNRLIIIKEGLDHVTIWNVEFQMNCNQKQHGNRNKLVRGKRPIIRRDNRKDMMTLD